MGAHRAPIAILPAIAPSWIADAVRTGGGTVVTAADAKGLIWEGGEASDLADVLRLNPEIQWVQLLVTGIDKYIGLIGDGRTWTCARGVFGQSVAEHALVLALALLHGIHNATKAQSWSVTKPSILFGSQVVIFGGGSIASCLLRLLKPFNVSAIVVSRSGKPVTGATTVKQQDLIPSLSGSRVLFLAAPLTCHTEGLIGYEAFEAMGPSSWLVNVARGRLVVTNDLVRALSSGTIAGAALDVTDPEPLPSDHPLWSLRNCLITPHVASDDELARRPMATLLQDNVRRFKNGHVLTGIVDFERGY